MTDLSSDFTVVTHQVTPHLPQSVPTGVVTPGYTMVWRAGELPSVEAPNLQMGSVPVPSQDELLTMHDSPYILHARGGKLTRVPVEKVRLPDDSGNAQTIIAARVLDSPIYAGRLDNISKSVDGGQTWTCHQQGTGPSGDSMPTGPFSVLADGMFIGVGHFGANTQNPIAVLVSNDEGRSWQQRSQIEMPTGYKPFFHKCGDAVFAASDGTLIYPVDVHRSVHDPELTRWYDEQWTAICFRSTDEGHTWHAPSLVCHWWADAEGGMAQTPSGKIVATVRYQRPLLASDPPDLVKKNCGYTVEEKGKSIGWPYKTVFMVDDNRVLYPSRPGALGSGRGNGDPLEAGRRLTLPVTINDHCPIACKNPQISRKIGGVLCLMKNKTTKELIPYFMPAADKRG